MYDSEEQANAILQYIFYHIINETNEQGQTLKFNMLVDEFHERIANRTLVDKFPETKPFVEQYEKFILANAAMILTRSYRLYDTELVERLYKEEL